MVAGRPRTTSLEPKEMIALGEEMVVWVTKNKKNILHLSEWYTIEKGFIYNEWKTFLQRAEFIPYYEQALKIVGSKYLDKNSNVREGASQRWQRVYFKDLKDEEDETIKFQSDLKKQEVTYNHEESTKQLQALMSQLSMLQSDRKIADINNKAESKS